ncbi:MAG: CPBP family intramembrane metalloprotease [Nocardioidaceae bacterium]|nr:CPBP family intramembrane metalloprotease [Nocardioidaceae bacterium]
MDTEQIANAFLLLPAAVFGVMGRRARRQGRTTFGLDLRGGAWREVLRGLLFGVVWMAVATLALLGAGAIDVTGLRFEALGLVYLTVYFGVLFVLEEIVFRGLLLTGLGVVAGQGAAVAISSVLIAVPYAFASSAGVMAVAGSVLVNLVIGAARWRTGRIWFGVGLKVGWNVAMTAAGFSNAGYADLPGRSEGLGLSGPDWITGGAFGPEAGVVTMAVGVLMLVAVARLVDTGDRGPWTIADPSTSRGGSD